MPLRWEQLPASVRARVRAAEAAEPRKRKAPTRTEGVPYRCSAPGCGWPFMWTTTQDGTPKAVADHQAATGHATYAMVLDGDA